MPGHDRFVREVSTRPPSVGIVVLVGDHEAVVGVEMTDTVDHLELVSLGQVLANGRNGESFVLDVDLARVEEQRLFHADIRQLPGLGVYVLRALPSKARRWLQSDRDPVDS